MNQFSSKNGCFLTVFSYRGTEQPINIQKRMKLTIHFWMVIIYFHNWMTLTIQTWMNVTVVKTIQNWMTLTIQNWMNLTDVNTIQNWMTLTIQNWMNVTVVNTIQNWMTLILQNWMNLTVVNTIQNWMNVTVVNTIQYWMTLTIQNWMNVTVVNTINFLRNLVLVVNWSVGMREIIRHCYTRYGLDPEQYIQEDPEDTRERSIEPADLTSVQDWQ